MDNVQKFIVLNAEMQYLIEELQSMCEDHFGVSPENIKNWHIKELEMRIKILKTIINNL